MKRTVRDVIGDSQVNIHMTSPEESITEAVKRMFANHVGCLIVQKDNKYVGIITERDIARCLAESTDVYSLTVDKAMTRMIRFVGPEDTLEHASQIMRSKGFRHLPVFENDKIIYVLSIRDIAFAEVEDLQNDVRVLTDHVFSWELNGEKRDFYKDVIGDRQTG